VRIKPMPVETELRFMLTAAQARALGAHPRLAGTLQRRPLLSIYFDTPELALAQRRAGLRLRRIGRTWVQTFKCSLAGGGDHQRGEWEWPVARSALDFSKLAETPLADWFDKARNREALAPRFETRFSRSTALIEFEQSAIEVAIDRGKIVAGELAAPILELELELKSGPIDGLYAAAKAFNRDLALAIEPRSKAARGVALLTGAVEAPVKGGRLQLEEGSTVEEAFAAVIQHCLNHLQANARGVRHAEDPEYVHQARVALRRLRSALATFRRAVPRSSCEALSQEARSLASAMGHARNLDVFEDETLKPLVEAGCRASLDGVFARLERERARARLQAAAALSPPRFTAFLLDMLHWLDTRGWRPGPDDSEPAPSGGAGRPVGPNTERATDPRGVRHRVLEQQGAGIRRFAASTLGRRHRAVLAAGTQPSSMAPAARHELRIAIKKLRYAAEFFAALYPNRASAPYLEVMAELQQALGTLNDIVTGEQLAATDFSQTLDPAGVALLAGWRAGLGSATLQDADRAWKRFSTLQGFW